MITYQDVLDTLKKEDAVTVLEILDLSVDELVDELDSVIYDKQDRVRDYYREDDTEAVDW